MSDQPWQGSWRGNVSVTLTTCQLPEDKIRMRGDGGRRRNNQDRDNRMRDMNRDLERERNRLRNIERNMNRKRIYGNKKNNNMQM